MGHENIVAVGLLTQQDLDVLGRGFTRYFPPPKDDLFADLLRQLDQVTAVAPAGRRGDGPR